MCSYSLDRATACTTATDLERQERDPRADRPRVARAKEARAREARMDRTAPMATAQEKQGRAPESQEKEVGRMDIPTTTQRGPRLLPRDPRADPTSPIRCSLSHPVVFCNLIC